MGVEKLIQGESIATGLTKTGGRDCRLRLRREPDGSGFECYVLENIPRREELRIPRFLFEFFRTAVKRAIKNLSAPEFSEVAVEFKGRVKFRFEGQKSGAVKIVAVDQREGATGQMLVNITILQLMHELLHDERVEHGSDVLKRILAYHKLFKFTFQEGSESLNSGLALRTDVLSQVEDYVPPVGRRAGKMALNLSTTPHGDVPGEQKVKLPGAGKDVKEGEAKVFKSRLAERDGGKAWKVDYQSLFANNAQRSYDRQPRANTGEESKKEGAPRHAWLIPLLASEIKSMRAASWRCELGVEEMKLMRDSFLESRDSEYFLGFDIIDAIYKSSSGKLKTFRFPLYYMPVEIQESGRVIILTPNEGPRFYLNHLALATLVEAFSPEANGETAVTEFFQTVLAQRLEVQGKMGRIYLSRTLPCHEEVFDRTREVMLGMPGENGKGGILGSLEVLGAECDTDAVFLYKSSKDTAPLQRALELDLEAMQDTAERATERFVKTIPGRFLSTSSGVKKLRPFCTTPLVPSFLPPSTRRLLEKLNHHDIVLLEGPPGTGKTHTIMNLLIHAICSKQRILIVSDQEAAIHALVEKMEGYMSSGDSAAGTDVIALWKKAVKIVDRVEGGYSDLGQFCRTVEECLGTANASEVYGESLIQPPSSSELDKIDREISSLKSSISKVMSARLGPGSDLRKRVSPKRGHATTTDDIDAFVSFLRFMGGGAGEGRGGKGRQSASSNASAARKMIRQFVMGREYLGTLGDPSLYSWFDIPATIGNDDIKRLDSAEEMIMKLIKMSPKSVFSLREVIAGHPGTRLQKHFMDLWLKLFPTTDGGVKQALRIVKSLVQHPAKSHLKWLLQIVRDQRSIIKIFPTLDKGVCRQLQLIHEALAPGYKGATPLSLEVCRFATSKSFVFGHPVHRLPSIQEFLERLETLENQRSKLIRQLYVSRLAQIATAAQASSKEGGSNALTQISGMLHGLKSQDTLEAGIGIWRELQEKLVSTFPIWLCRKQAVSFLFPCREKTFDLVIVDEATQCRVDDALPLMFRARKVMVVGDDKQTVLAKNSVIDDYLFAEFNLDEHLRGTQARGIKGGGSHIFGLVKGIKEAGVMLDEHYRCPPDIIEYSNRYVYNSELKVMQWKRAGSSKSMVIDWSERDKPDSARPENGAFKAIETDMLDRYLAFVEKSIKDIERETGKRVNMEHDVALCYFLLKNEPYIKAKKADFLARLDRGSDVLDGAGAALQGKERPYIFYLWDISRSNMMAFRQGDDPDKRKGELNVLMSRPKRKAFHYLHKNFDNLDHDKASITDFLWNAWKRQQEGDAKKEFVERVKQPGAAFIPWRRSSGPLMLAIMEHLQSSGGLLPIMQSGTQTGVVVGDPRFKVDVVVNHKGSSIGVVDLCNFDWHERCADDVVDYYFQLKRAEPRLQPCFLFMHELADDRSRAFMRLLARFG